MQNKYIGLYQTLLCLFIEVSYGNLLSLDLEFFCLARWPHWVSWVASQTLWMFLHQYVVFRFVVLLWTLLSIPTEEVITSILVKLQLLPEVLLLVRRSVSSLPAELVELGEERPPIRIKCIVCVEINHFLALIYLLSLNREQVLVTVECWRIFNFLSVPEKRNFTIQF